LQDSFQHWPLPENDKQYAAIDGQHIESYMREVTAIAQQSRDDGNQFWGRIAGTKYDLESDQWLMKKLQDAGLKDVRRQELDLPPMWWGNSWEVTVDDAGMPRKLTSAFPYEHTPSTPKEGLDLEAVYVGLGRTADYAGRDVRGKAVVIYSYAAPNVRNHSAMWYGSVTRAEEHQAAAILVVLGLPGNLSAVDNQFPPPPSVASVPTFLLGQADGTALMNMIDRASPGPGPRVHLQLDAATLTGRKTGMVWGTLPGMTDETINLIVPMDSYFTGAMDSASGIAIMATLAEYYSKIPLAQRRRTIVFTGTPAHHNGDPGTQWMHDNRATVFGKSALLINLAHAIQEQVYPWGPFLSESTAIEAHRWTLRGSPAFDKIVVGSLSEFGVPVYALPEVHGAGALSKIYKDAPSVFFYDLGILDHSSGDIPDRVPAPGLESVARAYAKIIDEVNKLDRTDVLASPDVP
jgi:hypothetical protein